MFRQGSRLVGGADLISDWASRRDKTGCGQRIRNLSPLLWGWTYTCSHEGRHGVGAGVCFEWFE